jgi:hypothetical protein
MTEDRNNYVPRGESLKYELGALFQWKFIFNNHALSADLKYVMG